MRTILLAATMIGITLAATAAEAPTKQELRDFYKLHEGTDMLPIAWVKALPLKGTAKPFYSPENLHRYGLIDNPYPEGGMIGLSETGNGMMGINCAACHTNRFTYNGISHLINGAPSLFDVESFSNDLYGSLEDLWKNPVRFAEFVLTVEQNSLQARFPSWDWFRRMWMNLDTDVQAEVTLAVTESAKHPAIQPVAEYAGISDDPCVKKHPYTGSAYSQKLFGHQSAQAGWNTDGFNSLHEKITYLYERVRYALAIHRLQTTRQPVHFGPGRVDDFGGARDALWPTPSEDAVDLIGSSSFLDLWDFQGKEWVHWDLNMNSKFDRNLGQAITGGALYHSDLVTANAGNIGMLEKIAEKMTAPAWPNDWPQPDPKLVTRGEKVFETHCLHCHDGTQQLKKVGPPGTKPAKGDLGTDPNRAWVYTAYMRDGCNFIDIATKELSEIKEIVFQAPLNREAEKMRDEIDPIRGNAKWEANHAYVARSLNGIWASPPYLHNGSVLTLRELLDSGTRRKTFKLDPTNRPYNIKDVGYDAAQCNPGAAGCFDTQDPGNSNAGHTYGDSLSQPDRDALIEYLKTRH